jgi:hypothetical protein
VTGTVAASVPKILMVVPLYNHARTVRGVVERGMAEGYRVLVVDDGSTDGGLDAVAGLPVERLRLPENAGKGAAILAAAAQAEALGYDAILTIDADGQHDPADARALVESAAASWPAIVVGARRMAESDAPRSSVFGRDFSNFWVRLECGRALPDTQSGFRLYPVDFLVSERFLSRRYTFEVEVLVRAAWAGYPLHSAPVSVHYPPGGERVSHFHKLKDNLRLSALHAWLVTRSLLPWPHRRRVAPPAGEAPELPGVLHPLRLLRALSREHDGAGELAAAAWVGIFIGSLPIIPFGIATIVYVNHRLHLNKLMGAAASNVCVAPFVPFLCIQVGHFLRFGAFWTEFSRKTLLGEIHLRLWEWLLGAMVVGPLLGFAGAAATWFLVRTLRERSS